MTTVLDRPTTAAQPPARETTPRETRRQLTGVRVSDLLELCGSAVAALAMTAFVSTQLAPITSPLAFVAIALGAFLALYALLVWMTSPGVAVRDRLVTVVVHGLAFTVLAALVFVVTFTFARGAKALPHLNFFTQDMSLAGPLDPLSTGGIAHAIVGTLVQITIALAITVPLGLLTAVFLTEMPGRFARLVRTVVEAMTALPSIVAGLFVYATLILALGIPKSGVAAATAISIMMLPIMVRSSDVVLRLVPSTLKEASYALGAGQLRTVWQVVLPTTRSGLTTAVILATARGIGETSPVLLTSGFTASMNTNPTNGPMVSLPLAIFQFVKSPEPTMVARGFGTAAVLMLLVLALFVTARVVGGRTPLKVDARRRAKAARRAARDEARLERTSRHRPRGRRPLSRLDELIDDEPVHPKTPTPDQEQP
ncbi:phosphate ABC transporter permease PstA [Cellulomonas sp. HZM]|uniref:phosphate ABC transporter permease PstA n=1 Tax=Cellulomonas sp. HZM TaxID=1454010 RepID=UPI0009DCCE34|nr:phosphate ABC transporter permease PstA [Cellulomonas sp. HZM]